MFEMLENQTKYNNIAIHYKVFSCLKSKDRFLHLVIILV